MRVGPVDAEATRELRRRVLRPRLTPGDPLPGDDSPEAVHLAARDDDGTVVGACFVLPEPCGWLPGGRDGWRLRQMATVPDRRGQGVGAAVLDAAVECARGRGAPLLWCHAREQAAPFYARNGFCRDDEPFIDAEHPIAHLRMWRDLREPDAWAASSKGVGGR